MIEDFIIAGGIAAVTVVVTALVRWELSRMSPGYIKDADAVRKEIEHKAIELERRMKRDALEREQRRIIAYIAQKDQDTADMLRRQYNLEASRARIIDEVGPIHLEEPAPRRRPLLEFYTRLFGGRKAGNGLHAADDHGLLPEGGTAVSGGPTAGLPAGGEPDADASG
jgi:hypothetical protein